MALAGSVAAPNRSRWRDARDTPEWHQSGTRVAPEWRRRAGRAAGADAGGAPAAANLEPLSRSRALVKSKSLFVKFKRAILSATLHTRAGSARARPAATQ